MRLLSKSPSKMGFTLLELLVVIAILGILLSIGVVFYQKAVQNARDQQRKQDLYTLKSALDFYFEENGQYPHEEPCDSSVGITISGDCPPSPLATGWDTGSDLVQKLTGAGGFQVFIKSLPIDPLNNGEFYYEYEPGDTFDPTGVTDGNHSCSGSPCNFYTIATLLENPNDPDINGELGLPADGKCHIKGRNKSSGSDFMDDGNFCLYSEGLTAN